MAASEGVRVPFRLGGKTNIPVSLTQRLGKGGMNARVQDGWQRRHVFRIIIRWNRISIKPEKFQVGEGLEAMVGGVGLP